MSLCVLEVAGDGFWSKKVAQVEILSINLGYVSKGKDHGELLVFFNEQNWNTKVDGLIYTDSLFLDELNDFLVAQGLCPVSYSEQGMQGSNYVSCDVDEKFVALWEEKISTLFK